MPLGGINVLTMVCHKIVVKLSTSYGKFKVLKNTNSIREKGNNWKNVYINPYKTYHARNRNTRCIKRYNED